MGVGKLGHIVARLRAAGAPETLPAALIERATLPGQRVLRGTLAEIADLAGAAGIVPPALLIVGEVVGRPLAAEAGPATAQSPAAETAADLIQPI